MLPGSLQIFIQRNLEIHQLVPRRIAQASQIEVRSREWIGQIGNIKEQKSRLRSTRLNRLGLELRALNFVHLLAVDTAFSLRKRQRIFRARWPHVSNPPI